MSATALRDLNKAISARELQGAYVLHGEEEFLKEAKVAVIIDAVLDASERDFNLDILRGSEVSAEALDSVLGTPPMFADRRVVVIREAGALKKRAREVLDRHMAAAAPDLLLLLVEPGEMSKGEKAFASGARVVEFRKLAGPELEKWVQHHASSLGVQVTPEAIRLLVASVGNDLSGLASELDKLASYVAGGTIDEEAVSSLVGVRSGETTADLLDAVAQREPGRAAALVRRVLSEPRTTAVSLILALSTHMLAITYARALRDEGQSRTKVGELLYAHLRSKRPMTSRPWGEAVPLWIKAADNWTLPELRVALDALLRSDVASKETRTSSEEQLILSLLLEIGSIGRDSPK